MLFSDLHLLAKHNPISFLSVLIRIAILAFLVANYTEGRAQSLESEQVQYPNSEIAFICGPQLKAGSSLNPAPWFDATARSIGITQGEQNPRIAPIGPMRFDSGTWRNVINGRVGVSTGSLAVTGVGTAFTGDIDARGSSPYYNGRLRIRDAGGLERSVQVKSVESDTRLTLVEPWAYGTVSNTVADTYYADPHNGANTDHYYNDHYYDTVLVQYINYYRTGEVRFLEYARKMADALWHSQWIGDGTVVGGPNHLPPRSMAFAGLMLRALDGRPEMWDYLERESGITFQLWVYQRKNNPTLFYDIRDDGYAQLYAVLLAKVLPDNYELYGNGTQQASTGMVRDGAAKRAKYLAQTEETAVNFFGRLQGADGTWRWDVDDGPEPHRQNRNVEQPFMVGLYLESVVLLHQLTSNGEVKKNLVKQLTSSVSHLYHDAYEKNDPVTSHPGYRWRGFFYYWGGGTVAEPNKYSPTSPRREACGLANCGEDSVTCARHLNSTIHHAFGYAYYVTGQEVYKEMGDEVFDASYGDRVDGIHSLADSGKGKDYAMNYRASGRYLVWRLQGSASSTPTPTPTATPTPTSTSTPTPTPTLTPTAPPASLGLVSAASTLASSLAGASSTDEAQITTLVDTTAQAYSIFLTELGRFNSISQVDGELRAALYFGRGAGALTRMSAPPASIKNRLAVVAYYLSRAKNAMLRGVSPPSADPALPADSIAFEGSPIIGPAQALSSASFVPILAPAGLGTILGDPNQSPLSTQTASSAGDLPYELNGVSVAIGGRAARLISVSPSRIHFCVPSGLPVGETEVIVTSQDGYVSRGVTTIALLAPGIFTLNGNGMGDAVALNAATLTAGEFEVTTAENFGADKQTRVMIFGSGLNNGLLNPDRSNNITSGLTTLRNIAEAVTVEVRTFDNRIFQLPVEFGGPSDRSYGVDQISVRLVSSLRGAGKVELTLIIAGQRSNAASIKIK